jgi:hypothetical protein
LLKQRRVRDALRLFEQSLKSGEDPAHHLNERWRCHMLLGDFERAWRESDRLPHPSPHWDFAERVVIRCLRGLGDALQFLRYAPLVRQQCEWLAVQAPAPLHPLLKTMPLIDSVFALTTPIASIRHDAAIEASDLPYLFRTTLASIPPPLPIERKEPENVTGAKCIGVVWAAGAWNASRSIPVELLVPALRSADCELISLQRNPYDASPCLSIPDCVRNTEPAIPDIRVTASTIRNLDLVITVDTMVAHLAGCLRRPVWLLLTYDADWRWMLDRPDSPWYPDMRLFRQNSPDDWGSVLEDLKKTLTAHSEVLPTPGNEVKR